MYPMFRHNMSLWEKDAQLEMLLEINTDENIKLKSSATEHGKNPMMKFKLCILYKQGPHSTDEVFPRRRTEGICHYLPERNSNILIYCLLKGKGRHREEEKY
jgi:hypothetical protein